MTRFRSLYGAGPLHLLALVASFAIAAAAVVGWFQRPRDVTSVLIWFAAAIVLHDMVLLPLYTLLDRIAFGRLGRRTNRVRSRELSALVNPTPYVRIPALLSGLLFAVFFPVILGLGAQTELSASGIAESGYLARWLLASGVIFAVSGVAYAVAVARRGDAAPGDQAPRGDDAAAPGDQARRGDDAAAPGDHAPRGDDAAAPGDQAQRGDDAAAPGDQAPRGDDAAAPGDQAQRGDDAAPGSSQPSSAT